MSNTNLSFHIFSSAGESRRPLLVRCGFIFLLLLCLIVACDKINIFFRPYVATVNGVKIYLDDYQDVLDRKINMVPKDFLDQPDYMKKFEEEVLDSIITEKIMYLRAQELNISVSNAELEDRIEEIKKDYGEDFTSLFARGNINYENWKKEFKNEILLQKLVEKDVNARIKISEDEIKNYFKEHRSSYKSDSRVRVSQIVVKDMPTAEKAMERLKSGEEFAKVAADMSIGPEASNGGNLGFIAKLVMPEPLDKTIFEMPVNEISSIVQSSYGFHIFKVMEKQAARDRELADVREDVIADIRMQKEESAFVEWLEELKKKAVIKKETNIKVKIPNK
ncbi:MAG: peptidyl-prolyl cis-trans isomerase [Syntrophaceae bacterium]|nr:peptidyl-prolyl cis-trans isomerase [Syntrophaceae bacterium]